MTQDTWTMKQDFDRKLQVDKNFDIVEKAMLVQQIHLQLYFVDGFAKDDVLERVMAFILRSDIRDVVAHMPIQVFCDRFIPYIEVSIQNDMTALITAVLSGSILLLVEGYQEGIIIDARTYPTRGMVEPEDDRVLRGSRDGFVETLILNTALIRRRIRDTRLCMEYHSVGSLSKTDVVLCYMDGIAAPSLLSNIRDKLNTIDVETLTMAHESLAEALVPHAWMNPFPKVRYTERPDTASSNVLEGKVLLIIDHSPSVLILPTSFFDFVQEAQDYYLPPIIGSYLRMIRILVFLATLFVTPIWFYLNCNPQLCPQWLQFTMIPQQKNVPVIVQLLILEFGIDALKMASLNTPNALNSSFSIVGALILGEFAINAGWLAPEIILYMAFVALADFTQPSFELGYAVKFMRVMILLLTSMLPRFGFWIGLMLMVWIMLTNKTITNTSYFYPLFPFHAHDFKMIFVRRKLKGKDDSHH